MAADPPQGAALGEKSTASAYETRNPHGIGKVFMGREISQVMGHQAAGWLERAERSRRTR